MSEKNTDIDEIRSLPHFNEIVCSECGQNFSHHVLEIFAVCPKCKMEYKVRAFGAIGTEVQDVIDTVLEWAGEGKEFEAVMERRAEILVSKKESDESGET